MPQALSDSPLVQKIPRGCLLLKKSEVFWRDHQEWLEEKGYVLRPRYQPEWVPSWDVNDNTIRTLDIEDAIPSPHALVLDATRIRDNTMVLMKRVRNPIEKEIGLYLATEPLASHPHNHSVPIYEVLEVPDVENTVIIVMPLLRPFYDPRFKSVGEAVEFFRQIFQGLQFMHERNIAHRDCTYMNIMMDPRPTFPEMFHPGDMSKSRDFKSSAKFYTRTSRPTKYIFIDFGLSIRYKPGQERKALPLRGGDKTVPEFQGDGLFAPYDPFPVDVYYLGNLIREQFLRKRTGVEFMKPLVDDMVQDDPKKRPTINDVVLRFDKMIPTLSYWHLRSRLVEIEEREWFGLATCRAIAHIYRTVIHIFTLRDPIPRPPQ